MIDRSKDNLLRLPAVQKRTVLSVPTIYPKNGLGRFPKQVKLSVHVGAGTKVTWIGGSLILWVGRWLKPHVQVESP